MKSVFRSNKKWNLRRLLALSLACVLVFASLPGTGVQAVQKEFILHDDDPNDGIITVWRYTQIKTQKDLADLGKGNFPMILCYTDTGGTDYVMTHTSIDDDDADLWRDGISDGNHNNSKTSISNRIQAQYNAMSESERGGKTFEQYRSGRPLWNCANNGTLRTLECMLYSGVNSINATKLTSCYPVNYESGSFLALTTPTDWSISLDGSQNNGCYMARIRPGSREFKDGEGYWYVDWGREAELELTSHGKGNRYDIRTSDVQGDSQKYIEPGFVQIYYDDDNGYDTGICYDGGEIGGIESHGKTSWEPKTQAHWSNFKMYVAQKKTLSAIEADHTIGEGAVMYAKDNLVLCEGVTLNIAPGGILCVTGTFINNGVINNCGTIVVNSGSLITSLQPTVSNSGQINCYGAKNVSFTYGEGGKREVSDFPYTIAELNNQIDMLQASVNELTDMFKQLELQHSEWENTPNHTAKFSFTYKDENGNPLKDANGNPYIIEYDPPTMENGQKKDDYADHVASLKQQVSDAESDIQAAKQMIQDIENAGKQSSGGGDPHGSVSYQNCQGDIVILDGGALVMNTLSECKLNLYSGATCVNNGLIIAPNGITMKDAELINRKTGTVFSGYTVFNVPGDDIGTLVKYPGTPDASVNGVGKNTGTITALARNGAYHVNNQGAFFTNGSVTGPADDTEGNAFINK